jgi:predicted nucleic acid-binding protein
VQVAEISRSLVDRAYGLLDRHGLGGLRPLDAVQLATCLETPGATLVLADRVLAEIAQAEGVPVRLVGGG